MTMLIASHRLDEAAVQVAALREKAPNDQRTLYADALLAYAKNDPARTREVNQKVLATNPDHLPSLMLAGLAQY